MGPALRGEHGSGVAVPRQLPFRRHKRVNVRFKLPYYTQWGQNLVISGSDPQLGNWNVAESQVMTPHHEGDALVWQALISVPDFFDTEYNYVLVDEKLNVIKSEAGGRRRLVLPEGLPDAATVDVHECWQDGSSPEILLSKSAFKKVIFGDVDDEKEEQPEVTVASEFPADPITLQDSVVVRFKVNCSRLERGQSVYLSGSSPAFGKWSSETALPLSRAGGSAWQIDCVLKRADFPIRYKYILKDKAGEVVPEAGADKELDVDSFARKTLAMLIVSDGYFRANPWRGAGMAVPVFSLRSEEDVGAGEYLDLKLMVDLAVRCGMRVVQLLPVNDTSVNLMWWDSYPYSSLSVFALHPLYLRVQALSKKIPQDIKDEIEAARKRLDLKQVDYEATVASKLAIARKLFNLERQEVLGSAAFKQYFEENKNWLRPYAAFCFLRDLFGTADHSQWGLYSTFTEEKLDRLTCPNADQFHVIQFYYYLQFHLHTQLVEAADYARKHRVVLKGDLPIGVDRNSVDTWVAPNLFRMNASTGAPPDYFNSNGQNWGFPTYNWEEMAKDDYAWWRARLTQMSKYFTAYRIDHILGFFRIWELPEHAVTGLMGRFRPSIPLSQEELEKEGLWDFNRLTEPYVRCHLLQKAFGNKWTDVAKKYFDEYAHLCYQFKKDYNTEKKIVADLDSRNGSLPWLADETEKIKKGLFDLMHEVVLIRDTEDPRAFYPRYGLEGTASFADLNHHTQEVLKQKYYDYFYHRQEKMWRENALKTLPVLMKASEMVACGEDLGMVPACVAPVLAELGLIGLRLQRMPATPGQEFGIPTEYEYMTVCSPSCHDCAPVRYWWEEDEARRARFFRNVLGFVEPPPALCDARIAHTIVQQHMESPSVLAIFPVQDLMALKDVYNKRPAKEEIINDPTNPRHYWRFRLDVKIEQLLDDHDFQIAVQDLVVNSGRAPASEPELSDKEYAFKKDVKREEFCGLDECPCYVEEVEKAARRAHTHSHGKGAAALKNIVRTPELSRPGSRERTEHSQQVLQPRDTMAKYHQTDSHQEPKQPRDPITKHLPGSRERIEDCHHGPMHLGNTRTKHVPASKERADDCHHGPTHMNDTMSKYTPGLKGGTDNVHGQMHLRDTMTKYTPGSVEKTDLCDHGPTHLRDTMTEYVPGSMERTNDSYKGPVKQRDKIAKYIPGSMERTDHCHQRPMQSKDTMTKFMPATVDQPAGDCCSDPSMCPAGKPGLVKTSGESEQTQYVPGSMARTNDSYQGPVQQRNNMAKNIPESMERTDHCRQGPMQLKETVTKLMPATVDQPAGDCCSDPSTCPAGKPVLVKTSDEDGQIVSVQPKAATAPKHVSKGEEEDEAAVGCCS